MRGMLGESWDGGGDGVASSRAAGDMIREAARCETLHLGAVPRPALVGSDLPLPIIGGLAMADDGWDPSSDMPCAQQALAFDAGTTLRPPPPSARAIARSLVVQAFCRRPPLLD